MPACCCAHPALQGAELRPLPLCLPPAATARTPFNGLSRFNSFNPSLQHTPVGPFRQHPSFAFAPQQGGSAAPPSHGGQPSWAGLQHLQGGGGRAGGGGAAAGGRQQAGEEREGSRAQSDATLSPDFSPLAGAALGINVSGWRGQGGLAWRPMHGRVC